MRLGSSSDGAGAGQALWSGRYFAFEHQRALAGQITDRVPIEFEGLTAKRETRPTRLIAAAKTPGRALLTSLTPDLRID
jgi:hypothetical protein